MSANHDPAQWASNSAYLRGVELFNQNQFWEAHEAWEEIWLEVDGIQSDFLQGLIQSAAALLKHRRGEPAPAQRLYKTAKEKLDRCPDIYMGLNVRDFQSQLAGALAPVITGPYAPFDPTRVPKITLCNPGVSPG